MAEDDADGLGAAFGDDTTTSGRGGSAPLESILHLILHAYPNAR